MSISLSNGAQSKLQLPSLPPSVCAASNNVASRKRKYIDQDISTMESAKRRLKHRAIADTDIDSSAGLNLTLGTLDRYSLADYLSRRTKQYDDNLTSIEIEENRIPAQALRETSDWHKSRTLDNLPEFLKHFTSGTIRAGRLSVASPVRGSPHTLVITAAGLRAADITRSLRMFETTDAVVAKLFAKHKKLKGAIEYVRKTRIGIGVGTPERLIALLDSGAMASKTIERIVVDCSYLDQKKRGILDMRETHVPLIQLLTRSEFIQRYTAASEGLDLLFF